ncbi:hypothetical protein C2G38_1335249 [Gigaspora rosea]|uniref:Uncharacterized protein n=1 Tax=Gigaspora rosea TaxID=44941 RepID=A0A397W467_9GLOM|nr:hypothetical protein C2G38_1335249 [Gigaspora rosea]
METLFKGSEGMNGICQRFEKRRATDRNNHHIPILVNGPGAGKSRFLQELPTLLNSQARQYTNDDALLNSIENRMFTINVTFGNGTFASEEDVHIGQTSVALRIIYQHFIAGGSINYDQFLREYDKTSQIPISDALDIVLRDVNTNKDDDTKINFIVVGIDEINHLHNLYNKELDPRQNPVRLIVHAVGRLNCSGGDIFYVPILAGTIQGPLEEMFRESTYLYLRLPLRLLRDEEVWNISKNIANSNNLAEYINRSTFRRCISDLGGQVRALELFYSILSSQAMQKTNYVDYVYIMLQVKNLLLHRYPFETYANIITPAIAHAILNIPVKEYDKADNNGQLNYIYLSSQDNLWDVMIDQKSHVYWQEFEEFNMRFWTLRLRLLTVLNKPITMQELFRDIKNLSLGIPTRCRIYTYHLAQCIIIVQEPHGISFFSWVITFLPSKSNLQMLQHNNLRL